MPKNRSRLKTIKKEQSIKAWCRNTAYDYKIPKGKLQGTWEILKQESSEERFC